LPIEFYAACEGYEEMKLESARLLRFSTYRIAEAMAGTKAVGTMESFWPLPKDKQAEKLPPMTKERYEAILKRHNVKIK
jgi:hypothetical protein